MKLFYFVLVFVFAICIALATFLHASAPTTSVNLTMKQKLSTEAYHVMYEGGTESPFSSTLNDEHRKGAFVSADTGLPLFRSEDKFDSGTGWPSFKKPIATSSVTLREDDSIPFEHRTEVLTADTGAHLGHVFDDGPLPLGKRWCMNGVALRFIPDDVSAASASSSMIK